MRTKDYESIGEAAADGLTVLNGLVRGMHQGIARRVFTSIGPVAKPAAVLHDTIAGAVYDVLGAAGQKVPPAVASAAAKGLAFDDDPPIDERAGVAAAIAALNGIYGDELADRGNTLATPMTIRCHGRRVELTPNAIVAAYPQPTDKLVVFLHGLCLTESSWRRPPRPVVDSELDPRTYGDRLRVEHGFSPVYVRYNTGLHISTNGRALDALLTRLVEVWPVPVRHIALVGHSMGGLVVRSACHYGHESSRRWSRATRQVVCLGSPHLGADLEKGVNAAAWLMHRIGETRALAEVLNLRSDGIKDLRYGAVLDEDWSEVEPDEFLRDRCRDVPFLPGARYHFVATSTGPAVLGALTGDHLVRPASASGRGRGRSVPFLADDGLVLTRLHHFDLLNHPRIYEQLSAWLTAAP